MPIYPPIPILGSVDNTGRFGIYWPDTLSFVSSGVLKNTDCYPASGTYKSRKFDPPDFPETKTLTRVLLPFGQGYIWRATFPNVPLRLYATTDCTGSYTTTWYTEIYIYFCTDLTTSTCVIRGPNMFAFPGAEMTVTCPSSTWPKDLCSPGWSFTFYPPTEPEWYRPYYGGVITIAAE